jgi:hypothetical protein
VEIKMIIIAIILLGGGVLVGGPLGFVAGLIIFLLIRLVIGIGGTVGNAIQDRAYETDNAICPSCKEVVKAEAAICKHCGSKFESSLKTIRDYKLDSKRKEKEKHNPWTDS